MQAVLFVLMIFSGFLAVVSLHFYERAILGMSLQPLYLYCPVVKCHPDVGRSTAGADPGFEKESELQLQLQSSAITLKQSDNCVFT